jgi:hypothetical protein
VTLLKRQHLNVVLRNEGGFRQRGRGNCMDREEWSPRHGSIKQLREGKSKCTSAQKWAFYPEVKGSLEGWKSGSSSESACLVSVRS